MEGYHDDDKPFKYLYISSALLTSTQALRQFWQQAMDVGANVFVSATTDNLQSVSAWLGLFTTTMSECTL